ncbi:hypothetical protein LXL04_015048 [Taraxacum kok-saghyz]
MRPSSDAQLLPPSSSLCPASSSGVVRNSTPTETGFCSDDFRQTAVFLPVCKRQGDDKSFYRFQLGSHEVMRTNQKTHKKTESEEEEEPVRRRRKIAPVAEGTSPEEEPVRRRKIAPEECRSCPASEEEGRSCPATEEDIRRRRVGRRRRSLVGRRRKSPEREEASVWRLKWR